MSELDRLPPDHREIERTKAYRMTFTLGTPAHAAFVDLGRYCKVFEEAVRNSDDALILVGLQRAFRHIWNHLNLSDDDLAIIYVPLPLTRNRNMQGE